MHADTLFPTVASACAVLGFLGVAGRWVHRWFTRLENAVAVVEKRTSKELEPNSGSSIKDSIALIRITQDRHTADLAVLTARVDSLAADAAATRRQS